jgi:hypothetical protein
VPESVGDAVLVALDSDPSRRFAAAGELADALRRGLTGESPTGTAATRVLAGDEPTPPTRHLPRSRTQRRPQRRPVPPRQPSPAPAQRRRRAPTVARNLLALIAILLLAAVVAAIVVLASGGGGNKIDLDQVVKENVNDQIDALRQVVEDNTE